MAKGNPSPTSRKGRPNKSTAEVREAIAAFASANVDSMGTWLNQIDSPEKKLDLFLRAIEYHIPKLARTEVNASVEVSQKPEDLTDEQLASIASRAK